MEELTTVILRLQAWLSMASIEDLRGKKYVACVRSFKSRTRAISWRLA